MKFNFLLGTFPIVILVNACGMHVDPGPAHDGGEDATGGSTGDGAGNAAGSKSDGAGNAAGSKSDGAGNVAGSKSDGAGNGAGSKSGGHAGTGGTQSTSEGTGGTKGDSAGSVGGSKSDGDGDAAGSNGDGDGEAGANDSDGEAGASDGNAAGANGDGDGENHGDAGSGAVLSSGGSGGLAGSAGFGGLSSTGGSGGVSASGGSDALAGGGGSVGVSGGGGSGGLANTGGSDGLPSSGGSGGLANTGGSAGLAGSAGSGVSGGGGSSGDSDGQYLFTTETFGGNGRTCTTCHTAETGTISPDQVQALYATDPSDPLFRAIDSDDGVGSTYTQLEDHATFRVSIDLPPGVTLTSDPSATSVVLRRGVPTTINTPALDPVLMWDGRAASLTDQALGAITGHAQATVTPTSNELQLIAEFEQGDDFFSSDLLRQYSQGGPEPTWPPGVSDSEQRGRRWFAQDSAAPRFNICGQCHGGPMANTTQSNSGLPVGARFQTVNVSEFNHLNNPTYEFAFPDPNHPGQTVTVVTPDPGRALITGDFRDVNFFKIPPLWGVKNTAPYFHDNSAATLEELADHYQQHLATFLPSNATYPRPHVPTTQDKADIVAYLKLL